MPEDPRNLYGPLSSENASTGSWNTIIVVAMLLIIGIVLIDIFTDGVQFDGFDVLNIVIAVIAISILGFIIWRISVGGNNGINHDEAARVARDRLEDPEFSSELDRNGLRLSRKEEQQTPAGREGSRELSEMFRSE
jgi:uncharacterized membrane protein